MTCYLVPCRTNFVCDAMGSSLTYDDCLAQYYQEMNVHRLLDCPPVPFALRQPQRSWESSKVVTGIEISRQYVVACLTVVPLFQRTVEVLSIFLLDLPLSIWSAFLCIFGVFYPLSLPDNAI